MLLDGAGITLEGLRRMSRWHGRVVSPKLSTLTANDVVNKRLARRKKLMKELHKQQAKVWIFALHAPLRLQRDWCACRNRLGVGKCCSGTAQKDKQRK